MPVRRTLPARDPRAGEDLPKWPEELGVPITDGYNVTRLPTFTRQQVMDGKSRYRSRAPRANYMVDLSWIFTDEDYGTFKDFYHTDLQGGSLWFTIELMLGSGRTDADFDPNYSFQTYTAHFNESYAGDVIGHTFWQVGATLELIVPTAVSVLRECDVYYPGMPNDLATDIVYPGMPAALAADIVAPCSRLYLPENP